MRAAVWCLLAAGGCSVDDGLLQPRPVGGGARDASADAPDGPPVDAGVDAAPPCASDADGDGACTEDDCDDADPARAPRLAEYCPDNVDNDCDDRVDFVDECGTANDTCEDSIAILTQDADRPATYWPFLLPLDRYQDDYKVGDPEGTHVCAPVERAGGDAVFELRTVVNSVLDVDATGEGGALPALVLRMGCAGDDACDRDGALAACTAGSHTDWCDDDTTGAGAAIQLDVAGSRTVFLIVDDAANAQGGRVHLDVRILRDE